MADIVITDQNFKSEVLDNKTLTVVDFWAPWCQPCKIVSPVIEALAEEYKGRVKVGKMDVDENPETSGQYGVMSIPSIVFFKNGQPVKTMVGAQAKENYKRTIDELLAN